LPVSRGHRVLLLSTAVAITAGAAGAAAFGDAQDNPTAPPPPRDFASFSGGDWQWSFSSSSSSRDDDVIRVRSRRCPKHHPHRVGSFYYSSTKIVDGKVDSHTAKGSFCAK
jgi:hypothetical protein